MQAFSLLRTTLNTRDLGGHRTADGRVTARNRVWRSDHPLDPDPEDVRLMLDKGITTVIDMRDEVRVSQKPNGLTGRPGFTVYNFPVLEGSTLPESVEAVPGSYLKIACAPNMKNIFGTIAEAERGVLYNCSAGKDRTGVVTAVLLMHCGVSDEEIVEDYMLTKVCNQKRFEMIRERFPDMDMNIAVPRESFMRDFMGLFRERFGGTKGYFDWLGLPADRAERLRDMLLG